MLTHDQKSTQLDISRYLLSGYEDDMRDFIKPVVTKYETWVHQSQKCRTNNRSNLVYPLLRNLRGFIRQAIF